MEEINFTEGTLSFKIPKGAIDYQGNEFVYLINYTTGENHLRIAKNRNNGIKISYQYDNFGKCQLEANAQDLDNEDEHEVLVTWSIKEGFVKLLIDGQERKICEIEID